MRNLILITIFVLTLGYSSALEAKKLKILTTDWSPYVSQSMECYGFTAEVVCYAFLAAGYEVEFVFTSWNENEARIKKGTFLAAFPHKRTTARNKFALFSKPIASSKDVFFYIKNSPQPINFKDLADLKDYKIGGVNGYYNIAMLKKSWIADRLCQRCQDIV